MSIFFSFFWIIILSGRLPKDACSSKPVERDYLSFLFHVRVDKLLKKDFNIVIINSYHNNDKYPVLEKAVADMDKDRIPTEQDIKNWYNKVYSSGQQQSMRPKEAYAVFLDYLDAQKGKKLLDVSCGTGFLLLNAVERARSEYERPTAIIAKTIPGKGVPFMEEKWEWHGKAPNEKETEEALNELRKLGREIR